MKENKIFISYAHEDKLSADELYSDLKHLGLSPWLDKKSLLGGQNWKAEIKKAIKDCSFFLVLLSSKSITKRGYVQKEIKEALDILDEIPESEIFIIPVRLDNCEPCHEKLKELHRIDLFPSYNDGFKNLINSILKGQSQEELHKKIKDFENNKELQNNKKKRVSERKINKYIYFLISFTVMLSVILFLYYPITNNEHQKSKEEIHEYVEKARGYLVGGNPEGKEQALKIYRELICILPKNAKDNLDQQLLSEAENDYKNGYYDDSVRKYESLFKNE
ncbi:toll/interleukin-1 receptor domain-containing protein [Desulfobacter curvatus]|uniref:toll/interleukin-1 receptor domain-containing protein n=1 Tax=Desulfobacter curvatus TaxID=2290 RepID=UPI0003767046|nr:toll/interleukin-1 receptor domain-containing protein [Desulfobacter curvatus]